ncbi:MAG: hypothetical protein ABIK15_07520 [Pseudomonadota bacterium]
MKKFIIKHFIIFAPSVIVVLIPLYILLASGELIYPPKIADMNSIKAWRFAYSDPTRYIKFHIINKRKPKIIAFGTSTIMQLRDYFFTDTSVFYNAGGMVKKVKDFNLFVNSLKYNPEVIIISLDHTFFNSHWDNGKHDYGSYFPNYNYDYFEHIYTYCFSKVFDDYQDGKIIFSLISNSQDYVGLPAKIYKSGFRQDGSYQYPENQFCGTFQDTLDRIENANKRFEHGDRVNPLSIDTLDNFLQSCKKRKIHVVAFLPPFANVVYNKLKTKQSDYIHIFNLKIEIDPLFKKYAYSVFDFRDITKFGSNDKEMLDGFHGSEKALYRIFIKMCERDTVLKKYGNTEITKEI